MQTAVVFIYCLLYMTCMIDRIQSRKYTVNVTMYRKHSRFIKYIITDYLKRSTTDI